MPDPIRLVDMTEPQIRDMLNRTAGAVSEHLPAGPGRYGKALFALLVFDEPGLTQYVSNANREDIVRALREAADRLDNREDIPR